MARPRRRLLRLDAFRLALYAGLLLATVHLLNAATLGRGWEIPVVGRLEHAAQDWLLTRLRGPRPPSGRVVIVAIDERSVEAEGLWPWGRARMARLVDRLAGGGTAAIGLDVVWSERDEEGRRLSRVAALLREARRSAAGSAWAGRLEPIWRAAAAGEEAPEVDPTERLADAIERARNVTVGFMFLSERDAPGADQAERASRLAFFRTGALHRVEGGRIAADPAGPRPVGRSFPGVVPPVPEILAAADSGGFFTVLPDADGVIRRYPVVASAAGSTFPSLGAALVARVEGAQGAPAPVVPVVAAGGAEVLEVRIGRAVVATDEDGRVPLDWHGSYRDFPTWSATDVLNGRVPAEAMRGRVAIVGTTAPGTWDQRVTPFDEIAPGVVTHATFVDNVLSGRMLERSPAVLASELLALVALAFGLAWLFARVSSLAAAPALLAAAAAWIAAAVLALRELGVILALGLPLAQMLTMFVAATSFRFFSEEREKRRARETFGRFLAPAIVEDLLAEGRAPKLGGEKRELTVLFADVRGFTSISERLDPALLLQLLNEYLTPMTDVIVSEEEGTLDKYMGDAIMAFWGAPRAQPDHALRACRAALAMVRRLDALREGWRARGLPDVDVGIGLNTGPMSVGLVGSQDRFYNYTVLGDAVNLGSRLEGANKEYGTRILVGAATEARVRETVVCREIDLVRVKGKQEPVAIHELLALAPAGPPLADLVARFGQGLSAYRAGRWEEAIARFREADVLRGGDPVSRRYVERCEALRVAPPAPGWDGVHEMRTK